MLHPGDVISYLDMCRQMSVSFQRGMYFRLKPGLSVLLMSRRRDAPFADRTEEDGRVLIYEGHDVPRVGGGPDPKTVDQPRLTPRGKLTQNGLFFDAVERYRRGDAEAERVAVYEKIHRGIWAFNGIFRLTDAWVETAGSRQVFRFRLELGEGQQLGGLAESAELEHDRMIPSGVKLEVWRRDKGRCVTCGATDNLHFDHIIPYSKGGSSLSAQNIQLLCARHNLEKRDRIE